MNRHYYKLHFMALPSINNAGKVFIHWGKIVIKTKGIIFITAVLMGVCIVKPCYCQLIRLGVDYLFEKRQATEEKSEYGLTQVYDIILQKRLRPLYDLKFKFQFKSERGDDDEDRIFYLPALTFHFGNHLVGLNLGLSKDNIHEEDRKYDLTREYTTFTWSPYRLPKITLQYDSQKTEREEEDTLDQEHTTDTEKQLILRDDYRFSFGIFQFDHSFSWEKKKIWDPNSTSEDYDNHDLHNKGRFDYHMSALNSRLQLYSDYEVSHHDKKNEETDDEYQSVEQKVNVRVNGIPRPRVKVYYNAFWGELERRPDDDQQRSIGNSLKTEFSPHRYLKTIMDVSHDNRWEIGDDTRRSTSVYGLRLEPEIPGLVLDPDIPMPPVKTSLLLSSAVNKRNGRLDRRTNSALLKGSTELYKGFELRTDLEFIHAEDSMGNKNVEKNIKVDAGLDLRDDLQYYFRNENSWTEQKQEELTSDKFDGKFWHFITYRPVDQFFLTFDHKIMYGDRSNFAYSYRIGWAPAPKLRLEARYQYDQDQSDEAGKDKYFSSEMNINISRTIKLRIKYASPSEDQLISFRFTLKT